MKIILSRKGFDSANGGIVSPIFEDGTMVSFPIPSDDEDTYDSLYYNGIPYSKILHDLRYKGGNHCHVDPDLDLSRRAKKIDGWFPAFGQRDAAASYLKNLGVAPGDIFLFFGNFHFVECKNGEYKYSRECGDFYREKDIALLILDVMMPKMNGWEVCREVRENSKVPIIMLTAKSDESDELMGFDLGVDEYISKPFSPKILVARVEAILRRTNQIGDSSQIKKAGLIVLDKTAHEVTIDGKSVELSFKEFELLEYFMDNQGIALSRERILNSVWNYDYFGDARTIDTHVKKLRSKLGKQGEYIKTVWGMGYKFEVEA